MIKGDANLRLDQMGWEIAIFDKDYAYTFELKQHKIENEYSNIPTTFVSYRKTRPDMDAFKGLADALQKMDLFPRDANAAQIKAMSYHLEDMRKLVFKND